MKKICFVTGTRADYGIMMPLMRAIAESKEADLQIIATNMHLSPEYGMTVSEIERDGFSVDSKIESLLSADTPSATVKSMGLTEIGIADAFSRLSPDILVILGDRYEMLAAASAALIFRIPVVHLHGGETTEGAYDDWIRHAITKLSTYHFTSTEEYAARVISMGENPENVFWTGSLAAQSIRNEKLPSLKDVEDLIGFKLGDKYILATFHPVTTQQGEEEEQTKSLLRALDTIIDEGWKVLFTMPNSDTGGRAVARIIEEWSQENSSMVKTVKSLGRVKFYTVLSHAGAMVGNSSSGIIEAPSFGVPTLNVGDRQKGRTQAESVINVPCEKESIEQGLRNVLSEEFRKSARSVSNPYEKSDTLAEMKELLLSF